MSNHLNKVAIVGMGPVGMILGAHLLEAGCEVAVCDTDKIKMNQVKSEGIVLDGAIKKKCKFDFVYSSISQLQEFNPQLMIVALKATHLFSAANDIKNLNLNIPVICAMNGIDTELIVSNVIGENNVGRMVVNFAGNLTAPNVTKVTFFNPPNYIASLDDGHQAVYSEFAELLNTVHLSTFLITSFELIKRSWEKTILNASLSALCAVGRLTIKEAMSNPDTVEIVEQTIEEAVEVAEAEKIKFEDEFIRKCLRYLKKAGDHFPSLAVDLLNNRPTEIDFINGKIVEYGRKHYIRTSLNLVLTNTVKAMSSKNVTATISSAEKMMLLNAKEFSNNKKSKEELKSCFLGVDLGSAFTKFTIVDDAGSIVYQTTIKTLNREKISIKHIVRTLKEEYPIKFSCSTGYGRKHFLDADIAKTELNCAAVGVSKFYPGEKNIIDIGGEDIKIIKCNEDNSIQNFYLNDKCAAGTGSFIVEVADKAGIRIEDMSNLAHKSNYKKELNSFCTVFAKTEIMSWLFEGLPVEDIARGIYHSIVNRVAKLRIDTAAPIYVIGGVVAHHTYLKQMLSEKYGKDITVLEKPQHIVSLGAALYAMEYFQNNKVEEKVLTEN